MSPLTPTPWVILTSRRPPTECPARAWIHPVSPGRMPCPLPWSPFQHSPHGSDSTRAPSMRLPTYSHHVASAPPLPKAQLSTTEATLTASTHSGLRGPPVWPTVPCCLGKTSDLLSEVLPLSHSAVSPGSLLLKNKYVQRSGPCASSPFLSLSPRP